MNSNEPNNPLRFGFFNPSMAIAWIVDGTMGKVIWYWDEPFLGMMCDPDVDFQKARDELVQSIVAGSVDCSAIPENEKGEQEDRRVVTVAELQHTKIQYGHDGSLVLAKHGGGKFLKILLPAFQVCRNWPERIIVPYQNQSAIEADRNDRFTLFDAVAYLARHNADGLEESEAFDACLNWLRDQLSRGEITATGIATDGFRYDIPSGVWEMARWGRSHTDPRTHRIEFIQPGLGNEPTKVGGTLTLHSRFKEKEPDWIDIRVPAEAIRAQVAKTSHDFVAPMEVTVGNDGDEVALDQTAASVPEEKASLAPSKKKKSSPSKDRALALIKGLFDGQIPPPEDVSNLKLVKRVQAAAEAENAQLPPERHKDIPSHESILRAAGRRKG